MLIAITRAVSPAINRCELGFIERQEISLAKAEEQHRLYEACLATSFSAYLILFRRRQHNSKPIRSAFQTAHFKSLYRKRSGIEQPRLPRPYSAGAFPIQP